MRQESTTEIPEISISRIILALILVPGTYVILLLSILLIFAVAFGIVYTLAILTELISFFPVKLIPLLGLGVLMGVLAVLKGIVISFWRKPRFEPALLINLENNPSLKSCISELCETMNTQFPSSVILHAEPEFFMHQGKLKTFDSKVRGRILALGLPIINQLTVSEFRSIIAHEFAHFTGNDTIFSTLVLPVYDGIVTTLCEMEDVYNKNSKDKNKGDKDDNEEDNRAIMSIPLIIPFLVLKFYITIFHAFNIELSRERERRADFIAAATCGNDCYSRSLLTVIGVSGVFYEITKFLLLDQKYGNKLFINYYRYFKDNLHNYRNIFDKFINKAIDENIDIDSTPSLNIRLQYLPLIPETSSDNRPASILFQDIEKYEKTLTERFTQFLSTQS